VKTSAYQIVDKFAKKKEKYKLMWHSQERKNDLGMPRSLSSGNIISGRLQNGKKPLGEARLEKDNTEEVELTGGSLGG